MGVLASLKVSPGRHPRQLTMARTMIAPIAVTSSLMKAGMRISGSSGPPPIRTIRPTRDGWAAAS